MSIAASPSRANKAHCLRRRQDSEGRDSKMGRGRSPIAFVTLGGISCSILIPNSPFLALSSSHDEKPRQQTMDPPLSRDVGDGLPTKSQGMRTLLVSVVVGLGFGRLLWIAVERAWEYHVSTNIPMVSTNHSPSQSLRTVFLRHQFNVLARHHLRPPARLPAATGTHEALAAGN